MASQQLDSKGQPRRSNGRGLKLKGAHIHDQLPGTGTVNDAGQAVEIRRGQAGSRIQTHINTRRARQQAEVAQGNSYKKWFDGNVSGLSGLSRATALKRRCARAEGVVVLEGWLRCGGNAVVAKYGVLSRRANQQIVDELRIAPGAGGKDGRSLAQSGTVCDDRVVYK